MIRTTDLDGRVWYLNACSINCATVEPNYIEIDVGGRIVHVTPEEFERIDAETEASLEILKRALKAVEVQ